MHRSRTLSVAPMSTDQYDYTNDRYYSDAARRADNQWRYHRPITAKERGNFAHYARMRLFDNLKRFKIVQFSVVLLICTGILLFQVAQCVEKYRNKSTGTADKYVHVSKTSFPVMTICPTYPYKLDQLVAHGIPTKWGIQFGAQWVSNDSAVSVVDFYDSAVYKVHELVREVKIFAEGIINDTNIFALAPNETVCNAELFQVKQYYYNGDCFALNLPSCLREAGVLEVVVDFHDKTDIFIHHEGQFLSPNSRSRVDVDKGTFVKIAVNHEVVQLLGQDGSCIRIEDENEDPNSNFTYSSFDDCMYSRLRDLMLAEVDCTIPWLPDKSKICLDPDKSSRAFSIYQENRRNQKDICPNSCLFTNMYFGPPVTGKGNAEDSNFARAVFYFRRDIKTTTEYFLYSLLSMVAEIGGYVGLLLGVSLFKLADINNVFLDWVIARRESRSAAKAREARASVRTISQASEKSVMHM